MPVLNSMKCATTVLYGISVVYLVRATPLNTPKKPTVKYLGLPISQSELKKPIEKDER